MPSHAPHPFLRRLRAALRGLALLAVLGFPAPWGTPAAQAEAYTPSREVRAYLESMSILTEEYPPYNFTEQGRLRGFAVDLLETMLGSLGVARDRATFRVLPWARAYQYALTRPATLLFTTDRLPSREDSFQWVGPFYRDETVLFGLRRAGRAGLSLKELLDEGLTLGAIRDDAGHHRLLDAGVREKDIDLSNNAEEILLKLVAGRIDLWPYDRVSGLWKIRAQGLDPLDFEEVAVLDSNDQPSFALHRDTPEAVIEALRWALGVMSAEDAQGVSQVDRLVSVYTNRQATGNQSIITSD